MFTLSEEQLELRNLARKVARDKYAPLARSMDADRTHFPREERKKIADLGLLALSLPEEYGGGGRPLIDSLIVQEEFARANPLSAWPIFEASAGPARVIDLFGTEAQKQAFLPPVASGDVVIAISISEADAGSAATDVSTRARIEGDEVVVNGVKRWCSGAGHAEQYLVYVRFSDTPGGRGMGAVLLDKDTPGLSFGPQENLMGHRGVGSADIILDDVRVPLDRVIIAEGGFNKLFTAFSIERLGNSTMCLAIAQEALDRTAAYVQEREQFGKPIIEFQASQMLLADMIMDVDAARLLIYRAAIEAGEGAPDQLQASLAKCFSNEMVKRVTDKAIQLHGGYGYAEEYELERMHRDAVGWAVAGGTPAIQRTRIASGYLGRRFDQRA
ncbi:acyl-CoA dehydrogenase family protein [Aeromicrobium fastidiosum]|uniref:Acyl-CoA dehydrogenase n=1 Tax=Aeromicrobium fastidiosum TaxID=52699 RepID=A0A641APM8_9ACTN|nr:acyl-CoA dehydrogenase family protein [Aeromicrobium fastidiosum]KAA1379889.1 acyl-CoA dehydrogenase [Aeromicrobium fastidiosum]MBP2389393.1 butyryl-CoA dehydrogenase [Aeromicrobium fastidiosum]